MLLHFSKQYLSLTVAMFINYAQVINTQDLASSDLQTECPANTCTDTTGSSATSSSTVTTETCNTAATTSGTHEPPTKRVKSGCDSIMFDDIVRKMIVSVKKNREEAKCNDNSFTTHDEIKLCLTVFGLPKSLNVIAVKSKAPIWRFFYFLSTPHLS